MADNIIEAIIRAKDEASRAFLAAASNADKLASEQAAVTKSGNALDQQAADTAAALERQAQASEEAARAAAALAAQQAKPGPQRGPDGRFLPRGQQGADPGASVAEAAAALASATPEALGETSEAADSAAKSVSNLSGRVMTLRYNLADVGQQLAGGANPFMVLMQQGPEIAGALGDATEAAEVLKAAFGGIVTTLAPAATMLAGVAVAAAALGTAMLVLKNATEEADEANGRLSARMGETAARAARLQEGFAAAAAAVGDLRRETADAEIGLLELTGQIDRFTAAATRQKQALKENTDATVLTLSGIEQAARAEREAAEANLRNTSILTGMTAAQIEAAGAAVESARAREAAAKSAREEAERERNRQAEIIDLEAEYQIEAEASNEVLKRREERSRAAAKATEELKAKYNDLLKALDAFQDRERLESALSVPADLIPPAAIQSARDLEAAINQIAPPQDVLDDYQRLTLLLSDAQRLAVSNPGLQAWADNLSGQVTDALVNGVVSGLAGVEKDLRGLMTTLGAEYAKAVQRGARVGGAIGDVIGGDITGAMSKGVTALAAKFADAFAGQDGMLGKIAAVAGPYGAAIGAAISGITALGQQGAGATSKSLMSGVDDLIAGFKMLPALVRKFIPDLVVTLITELIPALIANVPRMFVAIFIELPIAIVRGIVLWWRDIGGFRGIARSIADGVRDWWRETWDRIKTWFKDIFTPGDQGRGRRVSEGRAQELRDLQAQAMAVTDPRGRPGQPTDPRTGRSRQSAQAGPTLVLQAASLHPDVVPRALRDLDRLTRPGGLRRGTTVIGGT